MKTKNERENRIVLLLRNIQKNLSTLHFRSGRRAAKIQRRLEAAPPVLIFQMGKVGSSSLKNSLDATWPGLTIHSHTIMSDLDRRQSVRMLYDGVIRKGRPLFIISPVREPIARNVSAFFQNFERYTGIKHKESTFSIAELIRIFLQRFNHEMPLAWFDKHLKPSLGIDVYDYEFPSDGVQVIHHGKMKLLLMRTELSDSIKQSAIGDFLNIPNFALSNANVSSQKEYAEIYDQFTQLFIAPDWYVRRMYDSRFFNHFYGPRERNILITQWQKQIAK
jgi:Putative capsular polysaccharide synthesis protein